MGSHLRLKCPFYDGSTMDDVCGQPIEIDAWPAEKQTFWYPGSPAGFEVTDAPCGHAAAIEDQYFDEIMQRLADRGVDAREAAAEAAYDRMVERRLFRRG